MLQNALPENQSPARSDGHPFNENGKTFDSSIRNLEKIASPEPIAAECQNLECGNRAFSDLLIIS